MIGRVCEKRIIYLSNGFSEISGRAHLSNALGCVAFLRLVPFMQHLLTQAETSSDMHASMFALMWPVATHTQHAKLNPLQVSFTSTKYCICILFWLLEYQHLRYWVSIHAAAAKARLVHQGFHHLSQRHIIWPIIAVNIEGYNQYKVKHFSV